MGNKKKSSQKPRKLVVGNHSEMWSPGDDYNAIMKRLHAKADDDQWNAGTRKIAARVERNKVEHAEKAKNERILREKDVLRGMDDLAFNGTGRKTIFSISINATEHARLKMVCARKGLKMSYVVCKLVDQFIKMHWDEVVEDHDVE